MIINLSSELDELLLILKAVDPQEKIIDFSGILPDTFPSVVQPRKFDRGNEIELRAIHHYINFCGDISRINFGKKSIRSFIVSEVPLYWLTDLSEKHDSFHWGQSVFFMRQVLLEKTDLHENEKKIRIIVPRKFQSATDLIQRIIEIELRQSCEIIYTGKTTKYNSFNFFKTIVKNIVETIVLKYKLAKIPTGVADPENIFVAKLDFRVGDEDRRDSYLDSIYSYGDEKRKSAYFPFVKNNNIQDLPWIKFDKVLAQAYPSIKQLVQLHIELIVMYCRVKFKKATVVKIDELRFSDALIAYELERALWKFSYVVNYLWLKNYFDHKRTKINVLYIEEFYNYGRIVSLAIKNSTNKRISSYGIQHGLLLRNHTVYTIGDKEITKDDAGWPGMPIPDHFIVWGNYFKTFFLTYNSLPQDYVIVAGNMKYIQLFVKKERQRIVNKDLKILWCTSLPSHFKAEYQKVRSVLQQRDDYRITFRLHPAGHIKKNMLFEWIDESVKKKSDWSGESDIFKDMANHDLIICTVFSATFFDALILNKKTCRMVSDIAFPDFTQLRLKNLYDVYAPEDFMRVMDELVTNCETDPGVVDIRELCSFEKKNWDTVLFNN